MFYPSVNSVGCVYQVSKYKPLPSDIEDMRKEPRKSICEYGVHTNIAEHLSNAFWGKKWISDIRNAPLANVMFLLTK